MVDQVFPPIGKDGFDPDFKIQVNTCSVAGKDGMSGAGKDDLSPPGVLHLRLLEGGRARGGPGGAG